MGAGSFLVSKCWLPLEMAAERLRLAAGAVDGVAASSACRRRCPDGMRLSGPRLAGGYGQRVWFRHSELHFWNWPLPAGIGIYRGGSVDTPEPGDAQMAQVYCNRRYMAEDEARVSLFDRGFLFGDAVYEVTAVIGGRLIDNDFHLERLQRSLGEIGIPMPMPLAAIEAVQLELIARNGLDEGTVYLQVSRGEAKRNFLFADDLVPTLVAFTSARKLTGTKPQTDGIAVDLVPDPRWARRDIKTVMLLGQVLAKREASAGGFDDVWFVEDGLVTEGASSTAFIVTRDNRVVTRANSRTILPGCTRRAVVRLCEDAGIAFEERAFSPEEAFSAAEAFHTSASSLVTPVIRIAGHGIGNGQPGPLTRRLQQIYLRTALGELDAAE